MLGKKLNFTDLNFTFETIHDYLLQRVDANHIFF